MRYICHTETAEEVDEETFFHDRLSGGTLVLPALELAHKVIEARYLGADWNIYLAQASDGDCGADDGARSAAFVRDALLPLARYYAFVDIPNTHGLFNRPSDLWQAYESVADPAIARHEGEPAHA